METSAGYITSENETEFSNCADKYGHVRHANILEVERGPFSQFVSPKGPPWLALRIQKILENSCV